MITQLRSRVSAPNRMRAISTESSQREISVIEPRKGLSDQRMWAYTMSRWRLLTGTSQGSQVVPPEWCSQGSMQVRRTRFRKSSMVP